MNKATYERLLDRFNERAIKVSTVKPPHTYLRAVGTKELQKILDEELLTPETIEMNIGGEMLTGTHFRDASEALAHCYADLMEGRTLTAEEYSAAMRVLRMATAIIGTADPNATYSWDALKQYISEHAEKGDEGK